MVDIDQELTEYKAFLLLEKKLSSNSIDAYIHDLLGFISFYDGDIFDADMRSIEAYILHLYDSGIKRSSQARVISGIKSFFNYLYIYDKIESLPTELIEAPKITRKIPSYLTSEEVKKMAQSIDLSQPMGHRNRAIIEILYSTGLRVSELVGLRLSDLFFDDGYIRVVGKGDKERLVPISDSAVKAVELYREQRRGIKTDTKSQNYLFLGRRGTQLSRVMIFNIIKDCAVAAQIDKTISPHTFRHTFASQLIRGGADIRAVQQMLGHESIVTTEIYTHIDTSQKRKSVEKLFSTDNNSDK